MMLEQDTVPSKIVALPNRQHLVDRGPRGPAPGEAGVRGGEHLEPQVAVRSDGVLLQYGERLGVPPVHDEGEGVDVSRRLWVQPKDGLHRQERIRRPAGIDLHDGEVQVRLCVVRPEGHCISCGGERALMLAIQHLKEGKDRMAARQALIERERLVAAS